MNHDLSRDPGKDDEFFLELADMISFVDATTHERLGGGELDRRREEIMGRVHRRNPVDPPAGTAVPVRHRRLYSLAAAVVLVAVLAIAALFSGGHWLAADPHTTARDPGLGDPLPTLQVGSGLGGPDLAGQRYSAADPRTGVGAHIALEKKDWGTQISFAVHNLHGPKTCRLVAVHTDGTTEPLISWTVGEKGWGTAANPEPLLLQAVTATPREDIAHVQVQETTPSGPGHTLVRVP